MDTSHASALTAKHAGLDARLAAESRRPVPDAAEVSRLKKMKLKIKETLASS
jgi:hypothetical protein